MARDRSIGVLVKEAREAADALAAIDPTTLTEGELCEAVVGVHELALVVDAARTRLVGGLDSSRGYAAEGARSAAAWVAWKCRLPRSRASATVRCARNLRDMPATEAAFLAGTITADHVRLLADAREAAREEFERDEAQLVELAQELMFRSFGRAIDYWRQLNDPDGAERSARERYDSRRAHCSETFEAMVAVDAMLDPIGGAIYARELRRLEQELFEADWAEARERLGEAATASDLQRTPAQRRADAMVEMAKRSASEQPGARKARVLLTILAGEDSLRRMCELSNGTIVTPGEVLPLLEIADVERVVFGSPSRVIDVGVRQRLFTGATRRAIEVRDRMCTHPSCEEPAERCEIDHIRPYEEGGLTVQWNGGCKCPFHHRWHHRRGQPPAA